MGIFEKDRDLTEAPEEARLVVDASSFREKARGFTMRLDHFLSHHLKWRSRSSVQTLVKGGYVELDVARPDAPDGTGERRVERRPGVRLQHGTRVFVQKGIKEAFVKRLHERLQTVVMGDPLDEATNFGPMVSERQMQIVQGFIEKGKAEGARLVCGGERVGTEGFFLEPTVFADVTDSMTIATDEIFGPVMSVLDFETEDEAIARANATEFGLSAGVFTTDLARGHRVIAQMEAGSCFINSYNDAPVEAPFGGAKNSGVGRENSKAAIEHYSQMKSVYVRMGAVDAPF